MAIYHKNVKVICRERAKESAEKTFNPQIEELRAEYRKTKNKIVYSKILKLVRARSRHVVEAAKYYEENFEQAADMFVEEEVAEASGFKKFTNYLLDELKKI
jgi:hypothetical protein